MSPAEALAMYDQVVRAFSCNEPDRLSLFEARRVLTEAIAPKPAENHSAP